MVERELSFPPEALFRDLPDLLAGPEPILERPAVRAAIAGNDDARDCVLVAAGIANALITGRGALRGAARSIRKSARIPVEAAIRSYRRELMEAQFAVGLSYFREWVDSARLPNGLFSTEGQELRHPLEPHSRAEERFNRRQLALESLTDSSAAPSSPASHQWRSLAPRQAARELFASCRALTPGLFGIEYLYSVTTNSQDALATESESLRLEQFAHSSENHSLLLLGRAGSSITYGSPQIALSFVEQANDASAGNPWTPFIGFLAGCTAGIQAAATHWIEPMIDLALRSVAIESLFVSMLGRIELSIHANKSRIMHATEASLRSAPPKLAGAVIGALG